MVEKAVPYRPPVAGGIVFHPAFMEVRNDIAHKEKWAGRYRGYGNGVRA
jgi:hypothetical protein